MRLCVFAVFALSASSVEAANMLRHRNLQLPPASTSTPVATGAPPITTTTPSSIFPYPYPDYRYTIWHSLDAVSKDAALSALDYNEMTWNVPYTNPLEILWWDALKPDQQLAAITIGFVDPWVWECFQSHYTSYDWDELVMFNLTQYWTTLGWTKKTWDAEGPEPASENKSWSELTFVETTAATQLCYFNYTWDGINMLNWTVGTTTTTAPPFVTVTDPPENDGSPSTNAQVVTTIPAGTSTPQTMVATNVGVVATTNAP